MTFEATLVEAPTSGDWVDITKSFFSQNTGVGGHGSNGQGVASFVDKTDIVLLHDNMHRGVRVKVVTADATNAVKLIACTEGENIVVSD